MEQNIKTFERVPVNGTFELTLRCNLKCKMCLFRHSDCENIKLMNDELNASQWEKIAKDAAQNGTFNLLVTGGEPMIRKDFCEIWERIYKIGFVITLYTNATLITSEVKEILTKYPPHTIGITIYGASSETYAKVCNSENAFDRMLEGVKFLQTLPSKLEFRTTIIKDNFNDARLIEKLIEEKFGKEYVVKYSNPINKGVRGACADVATCRLDPIDDVKLKYERTIRLMQEIIGDSFDRKKLKINRENYSIIKPSEKVGSKNITFFGCQAGVSQYTITYGGKMLGCQMIDAFYTDVIKDGFINAWEKYPYMIKMDNNGIKCNDCIYNDTCSSCYASRLAETGDFNGCSDYIYQMAKYRKEYELLIGGSFDEKCSL